MASLVAHILAVSVFAAALQFHIATSASLERREFFGGQLTVAPESDHTCQPFIHPYCRCFNPNDRTRARFPNRRDQGPAEALTEFDDFVNITKSGCSNKIGGLLCFFYFPVCSSNTALLQEFLPCREDCEEVRRDCEDEFVSHGFVWPEHLDCSRGYFQPKSSRCISLGRDPEQGYDACVRENTTPTPGTDTTTPITLPTIATSVPNTVTPHTDPTRRTTESPTDVTDPTPRITTRDPPTPVCNPDKCVGCSKRFRTNCNSRTFIRNDYTWAAHVEVVRKTIVDGHKAYLVQVKKQYLPDPVGGPSMEEYTVVRTTSAECCSDCLDSSDVIEPRQEYLLSGHHTMDPLIWELDNHPLF